MTPQEQIASFEAHVKTLNKAFDRAKSILKPVFDALDKHKDPVKLPKKPEKDELGGLVVGREDAPEKKETYAAALDEIGRVWGTAEDYKRPVPGKMSPPEQIAAFEAHVRSLNKAFDKAKSILKPVFEYLDKSKDDKATKKLEKDELAAKLGKGDDRKETYTAALTELVRVWGTPDAYKRPGVGGVPEGPPPLVYVRRVAAGPLNELMTFAPSDLLGDAKLDKNGQPDWNTGLAMCANPPKREEVLKRYKEIVKDPKTFTGVKDQKLLAPGSEWAADAYAKVYEELKKRRAGSSTQFALAVAHLLTTKQKEGPRVEIVCFRQKKDYHHYYVLVGRNGAEPKDNKIPPWMSQNDIVIVDGWAAAMGHDVAFKGQGNYPFGMVENLVVIASWPPREG
jgi:hypothetical protein